jgi:multidrug efflux pump subunit AcrA (membrane-fusion protein)
MEKIPRALPILAALLSLSACYLFPKEEKVLAPPLISAPEVTYSAVEAKKGTIESKVVGTAYFVALEQTNLFFRYRGGRLKKVAVGMGDEIKAGALVAELDTGSLENRIAQQRILVRKAQIINERTALLGKDRYERELASLDVELAKLQLEDMETELAQAQLYAPAGGVVVYTPRLHEGDMVEAYSTVAQIADPRKLELLYKGDRATDFQVGMKVEVSAGGRNLTAEVVMAPGSTPSDVTEELRGAVVLKLPSIPAEVKRGDPAVITLVLQRKKDTVILPRDVVHNYMGRNFVQVMEGGAVQEKTVELGIQTTTEVEVIAGLKAGDQVLAR